MWRLANAANAQRTATGRTVAARLASFPPPRTLLASSIRLRPSCLAHHAQQFTLSAQTLAEDANNTNAQDSASSTSAPPASSPEPPQMTWALFFAREIALLKDSPMGSKERMTDVARRWQEEKIKLGINFVTKKKKKRVDAKQTSAEAGATAASPAAAPWSPLDWQVGFTKEGFRVEKRDEIKDFNLTMFELKHIETGTPFYHISRNDSDCAFSVAFRTPVANSTGVAHILEHTVLCGSERYPVRDPFFLLVRRSLKTFMNAMTAQDYTMYPFSTQNKKDFTNLAEVYLDAAFFPLLNPMDFKQEGHRVELESANAQPSLSSSPSVPAATSNAESLQIKGVVYNEMKGAMSDTNQMFLQKLQSELFPTNSNHWNSGGEPSVIPTLSHEELKRFHADSYHLDNAIFFSYGDMEPPLELVSRRVMQPILAKRNNTSTHLPTTHSTTSSPDQLAFNQSQKRPPPPAYQPEKRFTEPKTVEAYCPPDPLIPDPNKQTKVSVSVLCKEIDGVVGGKAVTDADREVEKDLELFGLAMVSTLLLDSVSSPMYRALIDPNIGNGYSAGTGYDVSTHEPTFSVGLQGISREDIPRVLEIIQTTLKQTSKDGFPAERVEAAIHQLELSLKHVRSNFGIGLLMKLIPGWVQGKNLPQQLEVNKFIELLRNRLAEGPYFQEIIKKHLLNNPHQVTLIMSPDEKYTEKEEAAVTEKLKVMESKLTETDRTRIKQEAAQLVELQNQKQAGQVEKCNLPSLSAKDISPAAPIITLNPVKFAGQRPRKTSTSSAIQTPQVVSMLEPTNGVGYFRAIVNAKRVPLHLRPYLPLYTAFLRELGTRKMDYLTLANELEAKTGGVSAELLSFSSLDRVDEHEEIILFKAMSLNRHIPDMLKLVDQILREPLFTKNTPRFHQLFQQILAGLSSSLQENASSYALTHASQYWNQAGYMNEIYGGIQHVQFMNALQQTLSAASDPNEVLGEIAGKLQEISSILLSSGLDRVMFVGDQECHSSFEQHLPKLLLSKINTSARAKSKKLQGEPGATYEFPFAPPQVAQKTFFSLPLQVNNVALTLPAVPYTHEDAPRLDVMSKILSSVYVHREVREKGGAYGGGVSHNLDGTIAFSSYRDPGTLKTLETYHAAPKWLLDNAGANFSATDIDEALLSIFSSIDAPKPPSGKGTGVFLYGITNEQRQQYRDRLLSVNKSQVMDVCERYLSPQQFEKAHVTIVGAETAAASNQKALEQQGWKIQAVDLSAGEGAMEGDEEGMVEVEETDNHGESVRLLHSTHKS